MIQNKLPWIISAVLAGLLIIVTFLWIDAVSRLDSGNLSAQKDVIREACAATDDESRARCQAELADLEVMLEDFAEGLNEAPQAEVELVATTTATSTRR
ncbi:MAG TPA: hypothetical protein VEA92_03700 [Candidatus Paceibacterota bacterium]|nr:hypothetical protein [Candidatus Paceibacterota bacterium]